jgi:predicted permease
MGAVRQFVCRLLNACRPGTREPDLAREIRSHLALLEDEFRRRGMSEEEATLAARRAFGGVEQAKDLHRDARSFRWIDELTRDVRYAARLLHANALFTLTAASSVAIGIGAGTTVFTAANTLLLRSAPGVTDPDRLIDINRSMEQVGVEPIPYDQYLEIRNRATLVEQIYAYELTLTPMSLTGLPGQSVAEAVFANRVSANYFPALGVSPSAGRVFSDQDAPGVLVLSHRFWRRRFAADPSVIGQALRLNDRLYTIVGVAAERFHGNTVLAPDLWLPADRTRPLDFALVGARLRPGVSLSTAAAELQAIGFSLEGPPAPRVDAQPNAGRFRAVRLTVSRSSPIPSGVRILVGGFLALLMGIVALVLIIASANVAGVLLARAAARRREIAIRLTLGVGRARLVRQLMTETLLLFGLGGVAGMLVSRVMNAAILRVLPSFSLPADVALAQDGRVVAFAMALSFATAVAFGLTPALQASRVDVLSILRADEQGPSRSVRLRRAFVIAQIAVSVLLGVVGGLLSRAMLRAGSVEQGFDPRNVETAALDLSLAGYTKTTGPVFARELIARVRQMPQVTTAALAYASPGAGAMGFRIAAPGATTHDGGRFFDALGNVVTPGYFGALRIRLVAGRDFNDVDADTGQRVAILSEAAVRRFWNGLSPAEAIGRTMLLQPMLIDVGTSRLAQAVPLTVVGVARDLVGVNGPTPRPFVYLPLQQQYISALKLLARTTWGERVSSELRSAVATMDRRLPVLSMGALEDEAGPVVTQLRIATAVASTLGIVGLLLAGIGIYGVTAYLVTRRTREMGVRIALGAGRVDLVRMVLGEAMRLVVAGCAIGVLLAAAATRLLGSLLFGIRPLDPLTFGGAVVLLALVGLMASSVPVRRALRINPVEALRYE